MFLLGGEVDSEYISSVAVRLEFDQNLLALESKQCVLPFLLIMVSVPLTSESGGLSGKVTTVALNTGAISTTVNLLINMRVLRENASVVLLHRPGMDLLPLEDWDGAVVVHANNIVCRRI